MKDDPRTSTSVLTMLRLVTGRMKPRIEHDRGFAAILLGCYVTNFFLAVALACSVALRVME